MTDTTFWLAGSEVPDELKAAYKVAARDKSVEYAISRILAALHTLIDEAGFAEELQNAVLESVASGADVIERLRARELGVLEQVGAARTEKRAYEKKCAERKAEIQPTLNACMGELFRLGDEMKSLQSRINGFEKSRKQAHERYVAAGLSDADIEAIGGVKPTYGDLTEWKLQLSGKQAREDQIERFLKSVPEYDLSLLGTATEIQES